MFIRINSYNGNKKSYMDKAPDMIINLDGNFIVEQTEEKRQDRIFEQINDVLIPSIDTLIIK